MYLNIGTASCQVFIATSRLQEAGVIHENLVACRNIWIERHDEVLTSTPDGCVLRPISLGAFTYKNRTIHDRKLGTKVYHHCNIPYFIIYLAVFIYVPSKLPDLKSINESKGVLTEVRGVFGAFRQRIYSFDKGD